jgi:hypothetical protein
MKRFVIQGIFVSLAALAACSSGGGSGGSGGTSSSSSASSSSSTASSSGSSSTSTTASSSGAGGSSSSSSGAGGSGGAGPCPGCVVVAALPGGSKPYGLFVDAAHVYWTTMGKAGQANGAVMQANLDGTSPVTLASAQEQPRALAVQDGFVFWGNYAATGALRKVPVGGGATVDVLALAPAVVEVAVDASYLWWTREPDDIQRIPITGVPEGGMEDLLTGNPLANGITVDAANMYWVNAQDGYVKKADRDLGNETALATGDVPFGVAVDATSIYWTEQGSAPMVGKVMKASKTDGSGIVALATAQASPQGIAIDGANAYWANQGDGTINKVPLAGGAVTVIGSMQGGPAKVAVDGTHVYWTNNAGDAVMKAPK